MANEYPVDFDASNDNRSAQVIQIDSGKHVQVVATCAILCALSACLALFAAYTGVKAERETRMLEYYTMELDGKVMQAQIIKPEESWSARKRRQAEQLEKVQ